MGCLKLTYQGKEDRNFFHGLWKKNDSPEKSYKYYPFGLQTSNSWTRENSANNFLYNSGTELNSVTGIYETVFRGYDAALGRFMQVDPLSTVVPGYSPYAYANCNPVTFNDPLGLLAAADFWQIVSDLWNSSYGGEWHSDGGGGGSSSYYGSSLEAFYAGAAAMDANGSWGGGGGSFASSFEAAASAYATATQSPIPLREVTVQETRTNAGWLQERIDEALYKDHDQTTPWEVGWEWLTGEGPRHRDFYNGDLFTELLKQHEHIQATKEIIKKAVANGEKGGKNNYSLGGVDGMGKYLKDYSTLTTAGQTGNLAVTYLGSYRLSYEIISVVGNTALIAFTVNNSSTIESATHPPVIGYTQWWGENIGQPLNNYFSSGPLSTTTQTFQWTETITWK